MDLGDFTPADLTDTDAEPDSFTFCGATFYLPPTKGAGVALELTSRFTDAQQRLEAAQSRMARATTDAERHAARSAAIESDMVGTAAMHVFLTDVLGDTETARLLSLADQFGVTETGLLSLCLAMQGAIGRRPTRRPTDSSAGPSPTGPNSTDAGSGPTALTPREQQVAQFTAASTGAAQAL